MNDYPTVYMPSTGKPAPPLLTQEQAIELLLIDQTGARFPENSLRRLREQYPNILKGTKVGRCVRFRLVNVLKLMEMIEEDDPR